MCTTSLCPKRIISHDKTKIKFKYTKVNCGYILFSLNKQTTNVKRFFSNFHRDACVSYGGRSAVQTWPAQPCSVQTDTRQSG